MESALHTREIIQPSAICVVVPTYNNSKTLQRVVDGILEFTPHVIIVNDGSTDETQQILSCYPQLTIIHLPKNAGKGVALRTGFKKATELHYSYAITIDSDGQHFATDIPQFITTLQQEGPALLIGSRNMAQDGIPKKSSFGNKFSNFWFWFETGIRLTDTQSGFRLYPLVLMPKNYYTTKFEFEIEVIVRSAWKGIPVKNIPVDISYNPAERVSHFRPFTDFTRISILNTVLVIITLFYIKPRDYFSRIKKKGAKQFFLEDVLHSNDSNSKKAMSIALGVFVGISPAWGFHTTIVIVLAVVLKLNKAIAFTFSNVSIPPMIPLIVYSSIKTGSLFTHAKMPVIFNKSLSFSDVGHDIQNYVLGSIILATVMAIITGTAGFVVLSVISMLKPKQ